MNSKGFPYVSSYQSYFSYEVNLNLYDPIISDTFHISLSQDLEASTWISCDYINPKSKII